MTAVITEARQVELEEALAAVCNSVNLDGENAQLLAYSSNVVYQLSKHPIVVRLNSDSDRLAQTTELVHVAEWLACIDAPIAPLATIGTQPVVAGEWAATLWEAFSTPHVLDPALLAEPLKAFHSLPVASELPKWDKFAYARARLGQAHDIDSDSRMWLSDAWQQVESEYQDVANDMPHGVIHGDAHTGNLLIRDDGKCVFCDLDNVAYGPIDWDLTPTAVSAARFGRPKDQLTLATAYGRDVTDQPWWPLLRRIRELVMVTYIVTDLQSRPEMAKQWEHRMHTLRDNETEAQWQRL
jgi:aminoglycoside phosphotransferase (APT) family kinase protein